MDRTNQLAQRLHELQFDRRMTQAQFSREIGLPRSTLQSIMTDGNTTVDTLIRIANALEVSLDELVFGRRCRRGRGSFCMILSGIPSFPLGKGKGSCCTSTR